MTKSIKSFLILITIGSLFLSSCGDDGDDKLPKKMTIDGESHTLVNGYINGLGPDVDSNGDNISYYLIGLTSSGLTVNETGFVGSGDLIYMYLLSPSLIELKSGSYTIIDISSSVYYKNNAISFTAMSYDSDTELVEKSYTATSGTIKISKSGSTFKISFTLSLTNDDTGEVVEGKGSYEGALTESAALGS